MPHDVDFSNFRHTGEIVISLKVAGNNLIEVGFLHIERRQTETGPARLRAFED
jgi:hypothetical protein